MTYFPASAPNYVLKHLVEKEAQRFRAYLGVPANDPVDGYEVAEWMGIDVRYPDELSHLSRHTCRALLQECGDEWSGMTFHLPDGIIVIVLNPTHSPRRRHATLMEEVGHLHLRHTPTALAVDVATGAMRRTYNKRLEQEAYWFGGAVLAPKDGLRAYYNHGGSVGDAADHFGISIDLVKFRSYLHGMRKLMRD
jgi:hypothetical protein